MPFSSSASARAISRLTRDTDNLSSRAIALMLSLTKRVAAGDRALRKSQSWVTYGVLSSGLEAQGTTLGLVGLVGNHEKQKARVPEPLHGGQGTGQELKIRHGARRFRFSRIGIKNVGVDDAVTVQKNRPGLHQRVDSHFIWFCFKSGCVTIKCHTTAWNASVCGVMVSPLTAGISTQASATFLV